MAKEEIIDYVLRHPKGNIGNGRRLLSYKKEGIDIQIWFANNTNIGSMLLFATGNSGYNIGLRNIASRKGLLLNRYGLWDNKGKLLASKTEEDIYFALGKSFKSPELRGLSSKDMREIWGVKSSTRILPEGCERLI